jgi:hypothetical protein
MSKHRPRPAIRDKPLPVHPREPREPRSPRP